MIRAFIDFGIQNREIYFIEQKLSDKGRRIGDTFAGEAMVVFVVKTDVLNLSHTGIKKMVMAFLLLCGGNRAFAQDTTRWHDGGIHVIPDTVAVKTIPPPILAMYNNRAVDTHLIVDTYTDTVLVTLLDNGTIDGDTVTLVVNGKIAHSKIGLTDRLRYFRIGMVKGQRNQIIMYADNLGDMPPNTALMRIYHSGKTELIYASSDYNRSFGLVLRHHHLFALPFTVDLP